MKLQDNQGLDVVFNVHESLLTSLRRIENPTSLCAMVRFTGRPENAYQACYKEHDSVPDTLTRTYTVVYTMPRVEEFPVMPGMAVNVEVDLSNMLPERSLAGVLVPLGAIQEEGGQTWAWQVDSEMKVNRTKVRTGVIKGESPQVLEGLKPGDQIVTAGVSHLREGMQVRPLVKERGL